MRILIDINHPAHVHYFRNLIKIMIEKGHEFIVVNRDDKMINQLLDYYQIDHIIRNKRPEKKNSFKSLYYLFGCICACIKASFKYKPNIYLGFGSSAASITALLFRKPCIILDDTEHNKLNHRLYLPGASVVLTPFYYNIDLGEKQLRFNAYVEQLYMHSHYFTKNENTINEQGVKSDEYVLVRYIAYDAYHDKDVKPLCDEQKKAIIQLLAQKYRVLLSMEKNNQDEFYKPYLVHFSPEKMHDIEAGAKFLVAEGATMASEAFVNGVPYVYLNPLHVGYIDQQQQAMPQYFFQTTDYQEAINAINHLTSIPVDKDSIKASIEATTMDPTLFLVWFVENYPRSVQITRDNQHNNEFWNQFA